MNTLLTSFADLEAWKSGHLVVLNVYSSTKQFPADEKFGLISQMRRAAVSVTSNIAEGFGRRSFAEKAHFYSIAQGSVTELQNQLLISRDIGYMTGEEYDEFEPQMIQLHKLMTGLVRSCRNHV